jgi:CAAX prenyl protease-like protein
MNSLSNLAPFVAPFLVFMLFLAGVDGFYPDQHYALYPIKTLIVVLVLAFYWRRLPRLTPSAPMVSVFVGIIGVILWVGLDGWSNKISGAAVGTWNQLVSITHLPASWAPVDPPVVGMNPFALYPVAMAWLLFGFRMAGISLCVPILEELFWRGFLMRWLIREDFTTVPLGAYQAFSFWVTTICFASVHAGEWPLGLLVGGLFGAWFVRTKCLGDIMLAHGVTNFFLALYCLVSGDWHFLATTSATPVAK